MTLILCPPFEELLSDFALELLEDKDRSRLEAHLATCSRCASKLAGLQATRDALTSALTPSKPPPSLASRLLSHVRGIGRFEDLTPQVAELFDLPMDKASELLQGIHPSAPWLDFPGVDGLSVIPVEGGPRVAGSLTVLARLRPGATFPEHVHHGPEKNLILQGGLLEVGAQEVWAGEALDKAAGSTHSYVALDGPDCIIAAVLLGEIDFGSRPSDVEVKNSSTVGGAS